MKIFCTVLRQNGTYKTISVKAGKREFELDKQIYIINGYRYGKLLGLIPVLRAYYIEGLPQPVQFDVNKVLKEAKLKIDSKAIKTIVNKKILDVYGEAEFTKLEMIMILIMMAIGVLSIINLILNISILDKLGQVIP